MSLSLPQGVTFPVSRSATALPLSMPPCHTNSAPSMGESPSQLRSRMLPASMITAVFWKAELTWESSFFSSSVR